MAIKQLGMSRILSQLTIISLLLITTASFAADADMPAWLKQHANKRTVIKRYEYGGEVYFAVTMKTPDGFTTIYEENGRLVCGMGGIRGRVNGTCPDFVSELKNKSVLWDGTQKPQQAGGRQGELKSGNKIPAPRIEPEIQYLIPPNKSPEVGE